MKMIWSDVYKILDKNMSDSNVGGRRNKNIRNHVFIINGIINEVINGKAEAIDIEIIDYRQCFDSMWLSESINDLYESGIQNENLAIIHAANSHNLVAVNTPVGLTTREAVEDIVMQGEVTGPGQCSNQVDTYGKECIKDAKLLYNYRGEVGIPPLGMVDDVVAVSRCGVESVLMNAFLNQKTNIKRLQYGTDKCHQLHVGKQNTLCPELYIDEWKLEKRDELKTGIDNLKDVLGNPHKIDNVLDDKYLGDVLSVDGKNTKNIEAKVAKATGISKQVKNILDDMWVGPYYFEVALILRNSLFLNGILTNLEVSYGLTDTELEQLEKTDETLLRMILECPCTVPKEMLYLEMGATPIRHIVMARRLIFYHYILQQPADSLLYTFFQTQCIKPVKNDWASTVKTDLEILKISKSESEIKSMSEFVFSKIVKKAVRKEAFQYLQQIKSGHSKVMHIQYDQLQMQNYFLPGKISTQLSKFAFICRTRMLRVGANYKGKTTRPVCPLCTVEYDSQSHLLACSKLNDNSPVGQDLPAYDDLFGKDILKQVAIVRKLHQNLKRRQKILNDK